MDTRVVSAYSYNQTYIDITTLPVSQRELDLIVAFLAWVRSDIHGEFRADKIFIPKSNGLFCIDITTSERRRYQTV